MPIRTSGRRRWKTDSVGPEILQKFDEAAKRYTESRNQVQAKAKAAPLGGVTASMILLEPDELEVGTWRSGQCTASPR